MKAKKVLNVLKDILVWTIMIISILMMVFTIISTVAVDKNDRSFFGYRFYIVLSPSMNNPEMDPWFAPGDIVVSKVVDDFSTIGKGDVITFIMRDPESDYYNKVVTHMVSESYIDPANGERYFKTFGTNNKNTPDRVDVGAIGVLGQYQFKIRYLGLFFQYLKTPPGYIVCVLVPFAIMLIAQGINCVALFRRYRKEQMSEMEEERSKIEAEREESRKMMEELLALKAQLGQAQDAEPAPTPADAPVAEPVATEAVTAETVATETAPEMAEAEMASEPVSETVADTVADAEADEATETSSSENSDEPVVEEVAETQESSDENN